MCDWSFPRENPFRGDKLRAVDRYLDIPPAGREEIKAKIKARAPDDIAEIERDTIVGRHGVYVNLRGMYFGAATLCATVTRPSWPTGMIARAPVYTAIIDDKRYSVIIPDVCGNVSRVDWAPLNGAKQSAVRITGSAVANRVPEPSYLAVPALLALVLQRRRKLARDNMGS